MQGTRSTSYAVRDITPRGGRGWSPFHPSGRGRGPGRADTTKFLTHFSGERIKSSTSRATVRAKTTDVPEKNFGERYLLPLDRWTRFDAWSRRHDRNSRRPVSLG